MRLDYDVGANVISKLSCDAVGSTNRSEVVEFSNITIREEGFSAIPLPSEYSVKNGGTFCVVGV